MIHAVEAKRLSTDPVALAMDAFEDHFHLVVFPERDGPQPLHVEHTSYCPEPSRAQFITELERHGYTVEVLGQDERTFKLRIDWSKPKVFNSRMEV